MKQKLFALLLALSMTAALTACGGTAEPSTSPSDSTPPESTQPVETETADPSETPEETETVEPSEQPSEEPSVQPSEEPSTAPSAKPSAKPSASPSPSPSPKPSVSPSPSPSPSPSVTPSPSPSPSAPAETAPAPSETPESSADGVDLTAFADTLMSNYEFSGFLTLANAELAEGFYPGLSAVETNQSLVYVCQMSMNTGELVLVELKDSADVDTVKAILQTRIDNMINGGAWYPEPTEIWTNSSRVVSNGNFVMMVVNPSCDDIVNDFNALF